jgi:AcrR family transcriptional regulator
MRVISAEGFVALRLTDLAPQLHCSVATLYKIASSKDSLIVLAIARWGKLSLQDMEDRTLRGTTAADRARLYWLAGADTIRALSHQFRSDVDRLEAARLAYRTSFSEPFVERFVKLLDDAVDAGELGAFNTRFLGQVLLRIALLVGDEQLLGACGLTAEQAMLEIDHMIWDGIRTPEAQPLSSPKV